MDQKLFEQLLTECADWAIPKSMDHAGDRYKIANLIKKYQSQGLSPEEIDQELKEYANETFPPKINKLKIHNKTCGDCQGHCPNGRQVTYRSVRNRSGTQQWCGKCHNCERQKNPWTGQYDLPSASAHHAWAEWIRNPDGVRSEPRTAKPQPKLKPIEYLSTK